MPDTPHEEEHHLTVRVGTREIYDAVQMLRGDLTRLIDSVTGISATLNDHEERLRAAEVVLAETRDHEPRLTSAERALATIKYGWPASIILGVAGTIATALLK